MNETLAAPLHGDCSKRPAGRSGVWWPGEWLFRRLRLRAKSAVLLCVLLTPALLFGGMLLQTAQRQAQQVSAERESVRRSASLLPLLRDALQMQIAARAATAGIDMAASYEEARNRAARAAAALAPEWPALGRLFSATPSRVAEDLAPALVDAVDALAAEAGRALEVSVRDSGVAHDADPAVAGLARRWLVESPRAAAYIARLTAWGAYGVARGALDEPSQYARQAAWQARAAAALDEAAADARLDDPLPPVAAASFAASADVTSWVGQAVEPAEVLRDGGRVQAALWDGVAAAFSRLDARLERHLEEARRGLAVTTGVMAVALLLSGYLCVCFVRTLESAFRTLRLQLGRMAGGDLTSRIAIDSRDETADLLRDLDTTRHALHELVLRVHDAAATIRKAGSTIADGARHLASGSEQARAGIAQARAEVSRIGDAAADSSERARGTAQAVDSYARTALGSQGTIRDAVAAMSRADASARRITAIVATIDGLAFQTNLLALNAAVEAARAGEQGRGFAVVATEVRLLARRSAAAASEIDGLIAESVEGVRAGSALVHAAGERMQAIVAEAETVSSQVSAIAASAVKQRDGVQQVSAAIAELDEVTGRNAARVRRNAALAQDLDHGARELADAVAHFRVEVAVDPARS